MKILLLTERFDDNIPTGVISKRIADELVNFGNEVVVLSSDLIGKTWKNGRHYICKKKHIIPARVLLLISNLLGINLDSFRWRKGMYQISKRIMLEFKPDVVYARSTPISVCQIAAKIKKHYDTRVLMHFTDPVPAPIEWDSNKLYRKRMIHTMNTILPYADRVSFGNSAMLSYQQKLQSYYFLNKSFVSPDPSPQDTLYYDTEYTNKDLVLSYLGSFHGSRNPNELFKAISMFNKTKGKALLFVYDHNRTGLRTPDFVSFVGRVDDVKGALLHSSILINLDGDDKEPVFISSKLKEYLCCGRPIISITPQESPSRQITDGLKTVISTTNDCNEIFDAIISFNEQVFSETDFLEREDTISLFSPTRVTKELIKEIEIVIK